MSDAPDLHGPGDGDPSSERSMFGRQWIWHGDEEFARGQPGAGVGHRQGPPHEVLKSQKRDV